MKQIASAGSTPRPIPAGLVRLQEGLRKQQGGQTGVTVPALRVFLRRLRLALRLRQHYFDVTLVDDAAIRILNRDFRSKAAPTDVLSFPWGDAAAFEAPSRELDGFLGDIVISLDTARRQAAAESHSLLTEVQQLVLHGALHLLGYDHEVDQGEMKALERRLRQKLGIARL